MKIVFKKVFKQKSSRKMNISEKKVFKEYDQRQKYYARSLNKMTQATKFKLPYSP